MGSWIRLIDDSGTFTGVNDGSIYTFKDKKYESLARETLQNSLDECLDKNKPVKVEFKLFSLKSSEIPDYKNFKVLFEDGLDYWKCDKQENGRVFFEEALKILSEKEVTILRISDFNTNGVLGSLTKEIKSSADITPWFNLIKSEGSSSKGDTQGGSFGIGKNASFANSALRTVFYSTFDKEGVSAHEGIAKLSTIYKNNSQYAAKVFFGDEICGKSNAISDLLSLDPYFRRNEYGTDIFIIGFDKESDWKLRMLVAILSDFILPIHWRALEVIIDNEIINGDTLTMIYEKYIELSDKNGYVKHRENLMNSLRYYQILTSKDTQTYTKTFDELGQASLKVLYSPDFDRKIMRTRETGMKLFSKGGISSSIGFSGIVTLEGNELNRYFRRMENPAHTAWSADNVDNSSEKKKSTKLLADLERWMRKTILENAVDSSTETIDVVGLGDYLPVDLVNDKEKNDSKGESISTRIVQITEQAPDRKDILKKRDTSVEDFLGDEQQGGEEGEVRTPINDKSEQKGGVGTPSDGEVGTVGNNMIRKKIQRGNYSTRLLRGYNSYSLLLTAKKPLENAEIKINVSGETSTALATILYANNSLTHDKLIIEENKIKIGSLNENSKISISFGMADSHDYALEVELYEHKKQ